MTRLMRCVKTAFAAIAVAAALPAHGKLVMNGGEQPALASEAPATLAAALGRSGAPTLEGRNRVAASSYAGSPFVELDTDADSSVYQDIATIVGSTDRIHFDFSPHPGASAPSNGIAFFWDDSRLLMIALDGIGSSDTSPLGHDLEAAARRLTSRLTFGAFGPGGGLGGYLGGYLDDVAATAAPEPGALQVLGLALVIVATFAGNCRRSSAERRGSSTAFA